MGRVAEDRKTRVPDPRTPPDPPAERRAPELSLVAAVAVALAVEDVSGRAAQVKWPNDVWVDGRKCAGILVESASLSEHVEAVVIGIGINRTSHPAHINRAATNLAAHGLRVTPEASVNICCATGRPVIE